MCTCQLCDGNPGVSMLGLKCSWHSWAHAQDAAAGWTRLLDEQSVLVGQVGATSVGQLPVPGRGTGITSTVGSTQGGRRKRRAWGLDPVGHSGGSAAAGRGLRPWRPECPVSPQQTTNCHQPDVSGEARHRHIRSAGRWGSGSRLQEPLPDSWTYVSSPQTQTG